MRFRNKFTEEFFGVNGTTNTPTRETEATALPAPNPTVRPVEPVDLTDPTPSTTPHGDAPEIEVPADASPNTQEPHAHTDTVVNLLPTVRPPEQTVIVEGDMIVGEPTDIGMGYNGGFPTGGGAISVDENGDTKIYDPIADKKSRNQKVLGFIVLAVLAVLAYRYFKKNKKAVA